MKFGDFIKIINNEINVLTNPDFAIQLCQAAKENIFEEDYDPFEKVKKWISKDSGYKKSFRGEEINDSKFENFLKERTKKNWRNIHDTQNIREFYQNGTYNQRLV